MAKSDVHRMRRSSPIRCRETELRVGDQRFQLAYAREFPDDGGDWYWASLWPSSVALALELLERRDLEGEKILEIGCGCGLAGLAAGRRGARVTVTDLRAEALELAAENWRRNRLRPASVEPLDWRRPGNVGRFDMILGADILYDEREFPALIRLLTSHLNPGGRALVAEPGRPRAHGFFARMLRRGFSTDTRHQLVELHGERFEVGVSVFR